MAVVELVLKLVLGGIGAGMAVLSVLVFRELKAHGKSSMASLQLNPEGTFDDFVLLILGTAPLLVGFLWYAIGGFAGIEPLVNAGRFTGVVSSGMMVVVLYRWWRRF